MTQHTDEMREAFERIVRLTHKLDGPWLRDCNDVEPQFTYQDPATEEAWGLFKATAFAEAKYLPLIEKLVGVLKAIRTAVTYSSPSVGVGGMVYEAFVPKAFITGIDEALALAAPLLKGDV